MKDAYKIYLQGILCQFIIKNMEWKAVCERREK